MSIGIDFITCNESGILNDKVINYYISLHFVNANLKMSITIQWVLVLCKILSNELWKYGHKFLCSYPRVTYDTVKKTGILTSSYTRPKKKNLTKILKNYRMIHE